MNKRQKLVSENPFYGLKALFALYQNGTKSSISTYLNNAWNEVKDNNIAIQLFHIICFAIGDITNRHHNIFGKKQIDDGGNAASQQWMEYLVWLIKNQPNIFARLLPLIVEYVGLRELVTFQVKTTKKKKTISGTWGLLPIIQSNTVAYGALLILLEKYINGNNPFIKHQVAKFVHIPRNSKRTAKNREGKVLGKRELQPATKQKMNAYYKLVLDLSVLMGWEVSVNENYTSFVGYREWQKQYNQDLESVLFSTGKIEEFDKEQFINWLNTIPAGARYRVQRRLFDHNDQPIAKWSKLSKWFTSWKKDKESLQAEKRVLENKAKVSGLSDQEKEKLAKVTKEAKVTTGAKSLYDYIDGFVNGNADSVTVQSILDKVTFDVPVLPVVDCSGSMQGRPTTIARLLTTLSLLKNPNTMDNLLFRFGTHTDCITDNSTGLTSNNRFMGKQSVVVSKLVDRENTFESNFKTISNFVNHAMGSTNFSGVAENIRKWVDSAANEVEKKHRAEQINEYQVILVISDGDRRLCHLAA